MPQAKEGGSNWNSKMKSYEQKKSFKINKVFQKYFDFFFKQFARSALSL